MEIGHNEARDAITARACGTATPDQIDAARRHVGECPACARWEKRLRMTIDRLTTIVEPVPEQFDDAMRELADQGLPEDPWLILLEVAGETVDYDQFCSMPSVERMRREAAEIMSATGGLSAESVVRREFCRVDCRVVRDETVVVLGMPNNATCVGVVVSRKSVPMARIPVRWMVLQERLDRQSLTGEVRL